MGELTKKVIKAFDVRIIKKVKRVILFIFIALIILDIVFVFPNGFPTISLVIYNSSPKFIVLLWLFGLFVTNVFFQRTIYEKIKLGRNFLILSLMGIVLLAIGLFVEQPSITCENYRNEIKDVEIPYVTRVLCQNISGGLSEMKNCDCKTLSCNDNLCDGAIKFKLDLTVYVKFLILILGILSGYFLWPNSKEEGQDMN